MLSQIRHKKMQCEQMHSGLKADEGIILHFASYKQEIPME